MPFKEVKLCPKGRPQRHSASHFLEGMVFQSTRAGKQIIDNRANIFSYANLCISRYTSNIFRAQDTSINRGPHAIYLNYHSHKQAIRYVLVTYLIRYIFQQLGWSDLRVELSEFLPEHDIRGWHLGENQLQPLTCGLPSSQTQLLQIQFYLVSLSTHVDIQAAKPGSIHSSHQTILKAQKFLHQ